nr:hypothetical protein [Serratia liquefaciens]
MYWSWSSCDTLRVALTGDTDAEGYLLLGRRLSTHYQARREAGPHWNSSERVKRNRELQCGFTLYGCDGDTLAWGVVKEVIRKASEGRAELRTPIRFQVAMRPGCIITGTGITIPAPGGSSVKTRSGCKAG